MRLFFAFICLAAVAFAQNSAPAVTSVSPAAIDAGGPDATLTVTVSAFASGAVVKWSGTPLDTTYVNDTTLSARVPAVLIAICGKYILTVTSAQGTTTSNSYPIIVKPVLKALSPNLLPAGSGGATVTASGLGFSSNVVLTLIASGTQANLPTAYGGPTVLSAFVPASALNGTYPVSLFVTDPTTGGVSQTLPITLTSASVGAISPTNVPAGIIACTLPSPSCFTLQVAGANFVRGAQVLWNGSPLVTSYYSDSLLFATVPAPLVHDPGDIGIQVKNPGTTASNAIKLVVGQNPYGTTILSLSPTSAVAGGPAFTLTLTGENFAQNSTVLWVRTPLTTTFVSATQLTATVPAALIASEGVASLTVSNPGTSNAVNFPINAATPTISSISPTSVVAGGPGFTLTVNGSGYIPASRVTGLSGTTTNYVSPTQLTVSVPAAAIASVGTNPIQVVNPGQVVSTDAPLFAVTQPAPVITTLSPSSASMGGPDFTLTVNGSNFLSSLTVAWNGAPLATKFIGGGQLTALVPAALIAAVGTGRVTVTGNGASSNALTFTIALPGPAPSSAGVLNAASSLPAIAPGALIAIFGSGLATSTAQFSAAPLPLSLGTTSVTINGTSAPLLYVSPGQVNAQVPYETKVGTAKLVVTSNGVPSPAVNVEIAATGPGVFTQDNKHLLALNLADGTLNASQTPARPGQYVTAYLTGQGLVDPPVTTGDVAPASPFSMPVAPVQIKIGGLVADIQFAGMAPGFVGLMQMNVLIPDVPGGDQPFDVTIGGVAAATTTISIAPKQ